MLLFLLYSVKLVQHNSCSTQPYYTQHCTHSAHVNSPPITSHHIIPPTQTPTAEPTSHNLLTSPPCILPKSTLSTHLAYSSLPLSLHSHTHSHTTHHIPFPPQSFIRLFPHHHTCDPGNNRSHTATSYVSNQLHVPTFHLFQPTRQLLQHTICTSTIF